MEIVADPIVVPPPQTLTPPNATPVLGTRVSAFEAAPVSPSFDDDPDLFEVIFEPEERTILPDDDELIYSSSELTSPCPPLESLSDSVPPPVELSAESEPSPSALPTLRPFSLEPMEPVTARRSLLPTFMTVMPEPEAELEPVTPPPRVALPEPRPSDVDDLLGRLDEVPFAIDELRSGLRLLAGMEPTPAPPRIASGE
jgi:hypothetical protein